MDAVLLQLRSRKQKAIQIGYVQNARGRHDLSHILHRHHFHVERVRRVHVLAITPTQKTNSREVKSGSLHIRAEQFIVLLEELELAFTQQRLDIV